MIFEMSSSISRMGPILERVAATVTRVIGTDALATARLRTLRDRVIALRLRGREFTLYATVDEAGFVFATESPREADVMLEGSVQDFIAFARARRADQAVPAGAVKIQGDLATAQLVQSLLDDLNIDWEELLAHYFGGVAAHQIGRGVRHGLRRLAEARRAWSEDLTAYLIDETRLVPSADDVEQLTRASMGLVTDVDRLAARVARLSARRDKSC
jgi:ubiquinone biosynthesis accessory factor UbiJ